MPEGLAICDPLTLAGIALTGASTVANTVANNKVQSARNDAMAAERIRQQGLDREIGALNTQSQDRYQNFEGQQGDTAAKLTDYFEGQATPLDTANASAALPTSASNITVAEETRQRGKARDFTNKQAANLGELRSFGDLLGDVGRSQARDATQIGTLGGFKRGSSAVLPYELEAANSKGAGLRTLGDVLGAAGSLSASAGINGFGGDTIANNLEIKFGADPWRGLRSTGDKSFFKQLRLGRTFGDGS